MAISDYIATLQKTKTYQAGLISVQEYSFKSSMFGLKRTLPNIPHADDDRHVVVMKIRGNQPNIYTVLTKSNDPISLTSKDADQLLFIFIEMRPQILRVKTPVEGYLLGDGHQISSTFTIGYQVEDAKIFWQGGRDRIAELETTVTDAAKNFFLNITSNYLINSPAELKLSLERHIQETEITIVKNDLEQSVWKNCEVAGIKLVKVNANVYLSDSLREHLQRMHNRLYDDGGVIDRWKIDQLIDSNETFAPHKLRTVIMALDMRLIENFYTMKWSDAMRKVTEKLADKKDEYQTREEKDITKTKEDIRIAEEAGLDEMDLKDLRDQLANMLKKRSDHDRTTQLLSDIEYLKRLISSPSSAGLLTSDATRQSSAGDDEAKD